MSNTLRLPGLVVGVQREGLRYATRATLDADGIRLLLQFDLVVINRGTGECFATPIR